MKKATGAFGWQNIRLTDGSIVEWHFTFMSDYTKLAYECNGYGRPYPADLREFPVKSTPPRFSKGVCRTLVENPQGAEVAAWYRYQAYRAHMADYPLDVIYALLMEQYHNDKGE